MRSAGNGSGQALVEFAMTIGVFFWMLFGPITASIYTVERGGAVTAVATGARVAVGGSPGPNGENVPDLPDAERQVERVAAPVLFGTTIREVPPGALCSSDIQSIPRGQVEVCASQSGNDVEVRLEGWPAGLGPAVLGLGWTMDVS